METIIEYIWRMSPGKLALAIVAAFMIFILAWTWVEAWMRYHFQVKLQKRQYLLDIRRQELSWDWRPTGQQELIKEVERQIKLENMHK